MGACASALSPIGIVPPQKMMLLKTGRWFVIYLSPVLAFDVGVGGKLWTFLPLVKRKVDKFSTVDGAGWGRVV